MTVHRDAATAVVVLDNPKGRNALGLATMQALIDMLDRLGPDRTVRTVVIEARGPAFSAGHDLKEMVGRDDRFYDRLFEVCTELMLTMHRVPQPVIAKVDGVATAAGCQLVASCDLVVASDRSTFATPGVKIGLFCSTPMVALSRAVGRKRALEMLLTGTPISAATAADWGLVNRVVPVPELDAAVADLVATITAASGETVGIGKEAFYRQVELDEVSAYAYARRIMADNAQTADAQEGIAAFVEKRAPCWPSDG